MNSNITLEHRYERVDARFIHGHSTANSTRQRSFFRSDYALVRQHTHREHETLHGFCVWLRLCVPTNASEIRKLPEDKIGQQLRDEIKLHGIKAHAAYGTFVYNDGISDVSVQHIDGRSFYSMTRRMEIKKKLGR